MVPSGYAFGAPTTGVLISNFAAVSPLQPSVVARMMFHW
jgi:hypothetical protein